MEEQPKPSRDFADEFRKLGQNIKVAFETAWDSEERKKLQQEIEKGLSNLGDSLDRFVTELKEEEVVKQVKSQVDDLRERAQSGELEIKIRKEAVVILKALNSEIERLIGRWETAREEFTDKPADVDAEQMDETNK